MNANHLIRNAVSTVLLASAASFLGGCSKADVTAPTVATNVPAANVLPSPDNLHAVPSDVMIRKQAVFLYWSGHPRSQNTCYQISIMNSAGVLVARELTGKMENCHSITLTPGDFTANIQGCEVLQGTNINRISNSSTNLSFHLGGQYNFDAEQKAAMEAVQMSIRDVQEMSRLTR